MRTNLALVALAVAVVVATALPAHSQQARSGLTGVVLDPGGLALPGVNVTILNVDTGSSRNTVTSTTGRYIFNGMQPGNYRLTFALLWVGGSGDAGAETPEFGHPRNRGKTGRPLGDEGKLTMRVPDPGRYRPIVWVHRGSSGRALTPDATTDIVVTAETKRVEIIARVDPHGLRAAMVKLDPAR